MRFANVRELKNRTSAMLRTASRGQDVVITSHGRPVAVLHGLSEDEIEDYVIRHHPGLRRSLEEALAGYRKRGGMTLDEVLARMERKRGRL
jgi:prevent-host-death family protein